jgi:hypothetical protein
LNPFILSSVFDKKGTGILMTELSFLVSLLLDHKLPKATQKAVKDRISEVEQGISMEGARPLSAPGQLQTVRTYNVAQAPTNYNPATANQPESTRKLLEKYPDLAAKVNPPQAATPPMMPQEAPQSSDALQPTIVASQAAAQALSARNEMIQNALSGGKKGQRGAPKTHGLP